LLIGLKTARLFDTSGGLSVAVWRLEARCPGRGDAVDAGRGQALRASRRAAGVMIRGFIASDRAESP